ncbi:hypothetical protein [Cohnella hongkongensis]|uniref:TIGR03986 family CRISPR-associated RAMP protein n=1 Tax=Cohnella hongkongensis TaxID=178337 RepID=A0ABV9FL54_9BACL
MAKDELTLPYDFIPFVKEYLDDFYTPYIYDSLPKFNAPHSPERLSGTISYLIEPHGDLVLETRETRDGQVYLSGSQIRGKIRNHVEMLSGSYPVFVDRSEMLYRNITDKNSNYHRKLKGQDEGDRGPVAVEEAVRVGYLQRIDNKYYIIPAKPFGRKNFLSIKEHWLVQQGVLDPKQQLFIWNPDGKSIQEFSERFHKIEQLNEKIKVYRDQLQNKWNDSVRKNWSNVFLQHFNFTRNKDLERLKDENRDHSLNFQEICRRLDATVKKLRLRLYEVVHQDSSFDQLIACSTERWRLKAEMDLYYRCFMIVNNKFVPYQMPRFFDLANEENVRRMTRSGDGKQRAGILFCSSNASSKRSHYLINEPDNSQELIPVTEDDIFMYKKQYEKMRFNKKVREEEFRAFYNLFEEGGADAHASKVVFFQLYQRAWEQDKNGKEPDPLVCLGRTPHFKIPYDYQVSNLLRKESSGKLDYARALFGFTEADVGRSESESEEKHAYKSRVRFGPAILIGACPEPVTKEFLLPSPSATAEGMYIHPANGKYGRASYEKKNNIAPPVLNGHKYYHVIPKPIEYTSPGKNKETETKRRVYQHTGKFHFEGKIHFTNVTADELGLLILGLDITKLLDSKQYGREVSRYETMLGQAYELIGGAKPYGYGKVKIKVVNIQLERNEADFDSLIIEPETTVNYYTPYIDQFIGRMEEHISYLQHDLLGHYILSKQIFTTDGTQHLNWANMTKLLSKGKSKDQIGYPRRSYLKSRFVVSPKKPQ